MAKAKKCDICEKLYELYNHQERGKDNGMALMKYDDRDGYNIIKHFDLCPECLEAIHDLIKRRKEESKIRCAQ